MNKLLIFYLTSNDRYFVFEKFIDEIKNIKNKEGVKILIVNSSNDLSFYDNELRNSGLEYDLAGVECPQSNYLPKVRYAIEYAKNNGYPYIMKFDNDVLVPSYTFDYIIDNLYLLDDKNLTISPTISTGIPSVEYFLDDFFSKDESLNIRNEFKKCLFHIQEGVMDYTHLNLFTVENSGDWNYDEYISGMNSYMNNLTDIGNGRTPDGYCKFYKGIHPIRHGFGNTQINEGIIKNKERFFSEKECGIIKTKNSTYLCDMCFVIKTDIYDRIINKENLIIDGCDEIPINRFSWDNGLSHLVVKSGYAIHITYNWRWSLNNQNGGSNIDKPELTLDQYELNFINSLYE
jgi:hypothetical protein